MPALCRAPDDSSYRIRILRSSTRRCGVGESSSTIRGEQTESATGYFTVFFLFECLSTSLHSITSVRRWTPPIPDRKTTLRGPSNLIVRSFARLVARSSSLLSSFSSSCYSCLLLTPSPAGRFHSVKSLSPERSKPPLPGTSFCSGISLRVAVLSESLSLV